MVKSKEKRESHKGTPIETKQKIIAKLSGSFDEIVIGMITDKIFNAVENNRVLDETFIEETGTTVYNEWLKKNPTGNPPKNYNQTKEVIREVIQTLKIIEAIQTSEMPENAKILTEKWSDNLFGLEFVKSKGYQEYLNSDNSLHQIWGAAALLTDKVSIAKSKNRELTVEEKAEVKEAFQKAANNRREDTKKTGGYYIGEGDELEELSKNIDAISKIIKKLE